MRDEASNEQLDQLMARVATGDRHAFSEFYALTADRCMALAVSVLGSRTWAEDCVADTYVAVWRNAAGFDPQRAHAGAWVMMMCRTRAIDRMRREHTQVGYSIKLAPADDSAEQSLDPARAFGGLLAFDKLADALQKLTPDQRRALQLTYFHGLSHSELAEATGWPTGTAKSHVRRALATLRKDLVNDENALDAIS